MTLVTTIIPFRALQHALVAAAAHARSPEIEFEHPPAGAEKQPQRWGRGLRCDILYLCSEYRSASVDIAPALFELQREKGIPSPSPASSKPPLTTRADAPHSLMRVTPSKRSGWMCIR